MSRSVQISLAVPGDTLDAFRAICAREGVTMSEAIRTAFYTVEESSSLFGKVVVYLIDNPREEREKYLKRTSLTLPMSDAERLTDFSVALVTSNDWVTRILVYGIVKGIIKV